MLDPDESYSPGPYYLHPNLAKAITPEVEEGIKTSFNKKRLLKVMRRMDFDVYDIAYRNDQELVYKKGRNGYTIWWEMEREGSGFTRLFKGAIKRVCMFEVETGGDHGITIPKT